MWQIVKTSSVSEEALTALSEVLDGLLKEFFDVRQLIEDETPEEIKGVVLLLEDKDKLLEQMPKVTPYLDYQHKSARMEVADKYYYAEMRDKLSIVLGPDYYAEDILGYMMEVIENGASDDQLIYNMLKEGIDTTSHMKELQGEAFRLCSEKGHKLMPWQERTHQGIHFSRCEHCNKKVVVINDPENIENTSDAIHGEAVDQWCSNLPFQVDPKAIEHEIGYKTASPLPLDAIPVEPGESQVDMILDEYTIQQLDERYNFKNHLGGGCWGVAYETFDGKVVKLTTDLQEVEIAKGLIGDNWQKFAPFARIYEVEKIFEESLYVIVKELLTPLTEEEKTYLSLFFNEFEGDTGNVTEEFEEQMELFEKFEEYTYDVGNYMYADVFNDGNIGWDKEGNLKCFDPRSDSAAFAYDKVMNMHKMASVEVPSMFSNCCYVPDDFIDSTAPFRGLYSDINLCPLCKKECEFIQEATQSELARDLGL